MALVAWSSTSANSYVAVADADTYFADAIHASAWDSATSATKSKALVTATRYIDRQTWQGEPAADDPAENALAWPRSGVTDRYGDAVTPTDVLPADVKVATYELALALIEDTTLQSSSSADRDAKRLRAGEVEIEYFTRRAQGRFPQIIQELLGQYMAKSFSSAGAVYGTDGVSLYDDGDPWGRSDPFG